MKEEDTICVVSDGLYHPDYGRGTLGWIITCEKDQSKMIFRDNVIPGPMSAQCLYRSKLEGLISSLKQIIKIL